MAEKLPPIKAEELLPRRVADQGRAVQRGVGSELPTPRSYSFRVDGGLGTTSGNTTLNLATMNGIWLQPYENLGLLVEMDMQATAVSTGVLFWASAATLGWNQLMLVSQTNVPTARRTMAGGPQVPGGGASTGGMIGTTGTETPAGLVFGMPYFNGTVEVGKPSSPVVAPITFHIARNGGTGNIGCWNLRATAFII